MAVQTPTNNMLKTMRRILLEMQAATTLPEALAQVVEHIAQALRANASSLFIIDDTQGEYVLMATVGLNADQVGKARIKFGEGLVGYVGEREEPINIENAPSHPHFLKQTKIGEENFQGFVGVPLIHLGELLGVLTVQQTEARLFAEDEVAFLVTVCTQLAGEIARAKAKGALRAIAKKKRKTKDQVITALSGAAGVAIGQAVVVYPPADLDAVPDRPAENVEDEIKHFESALAQAREEIHELQIRAKSSFSVAENALFDAYLRILDSRTLMNEVEQEIQDGVWAQAALKRVIKRHIVQFESLEDEYLQERATDFRDLGRRILAYLQNNKRTAPDYPKNTILVSEEVTPTALMEVPEGCLLGVISGSGSSNSHVAILTRALGLPTVMGMTGTPVSEFVGKEVIVDGYNGQVYLAPSTTVKKEFRELLAEEQQFDEELEKLRDVPAETQDGHVLQLFVNTGLAVEGGLSLSAGAEGVGLYRTEMPFMLRDRFPSEEEQRIMYRQLLNTFSPRPVVMRTLDVGGDKQLPYFPVEEENPFLGWRGIRITLDHPDIFLQQIRAMLKASVDLNNLSLLLPMITSVREVEESLRLIHQAHEEIVGSGIELKMPRLGVMIEVPAAVYQANDLARRVDFLSVGSNDLIQYFLAVDRNNPRVAELYNGLHPSVLRALNDIVKAGHKAGKQVSICGELASDPIAVILLLGMGFDSLSMNARSLLRVKWVIRHFSMEKAKQILKEVLKMDDPVEVRCHMEMALEEAGLGGLIRAGK